MHAQPITIDLTYLHSLTGGDKDFEKMLLTGTVADIDKLIVTLQKSWQSRDASVIKSSAHSIISLAAIAGMPQMEAWCRKIEHEFADGQFHAELALVAGNIFDGWPDASATLKEIIEKD